MHPKIVICGAGFLGSHIAKVLGSARSRYQIQISTRSPQKLHQSLKAVVPADRLLPPVPADVTQPETLASSFAGATAVISLVGIMHGTPEAFEAIQFRGAENVAKAARDVNAKLIHISAIGANAGSKIPYEKTKGQAETAVLSLLPGSTIIRPSIVFGPEDDFFNRFSRLSRYLPFLPVFGGGKALFQPVYVGDVAQAIELILRDDVAQTVAGKTIEAGGPDVFTYREIMELVLKYNHRRRPVASLPFALGMLQASVLEKLPLNLFTVTRSQVEQLKSNNIVSHPLSPQFVSFPGLIEKHTHSRLRSVHDVLPSYFR